MLSHALTFPLMIAGFVFSSTGMFAFCLLAFERGSPFDSPMLSTWKVALIGASLLFFGVACEVATLLLANR